MQAVQTKFKSRRWHEVSTLENNSRVIISSVRRVFFNFVRPELTSKLQYTLRDIK
jgi:hypothetical protein